MSDVMDQATLEDRTGVSFVSWLHRRDGTQLAETIRPGSRADASQWMSQVQPDIAMDEARADCDWDWPARVGVNNTLRAMRMTGEYFVITAVSDLAQAAIPIGLMTVFGRPSFIPNPQQDCIVIWHMSAAPRRFLTRHFGEGREPRGIGHALIDTAISRAFQQGMEGRVTLHATPDGGEKLAQWCSVALRMHRLTINDPLPRMAIYGKNDGRWFYFTTPSALQYSQGHDAQRK